MKELKCEFEYCIYNKKFSCVLKEIHLNCIAMCDSCITVVISEEKLDEYKNYQLQEIIDKDGDYDK